MRTVVIGGGVAGSASAIALARIGSEVAVYEAYEDPAGPAGSYVSLAVNGLRALDALGCLEQVQEAGFPVARQLMWSGRGKLLGDVARGRSPEDALHSVTLMRADLVTALREEALRSGARIVTGQRLTGTKDALVVGADLIVGADGIWSATRRELNPEAPQPAYAKIYYISGISDGAPIWTKVSQQGFNWIFAERGVFIYLPAPDGSIWWTAQVAAPQPPPDPAAVSLAELTELFRTEPQAAAVLQAATEVRAANIGHVLAPATRRHDGHTVLIGDAAHPVGAGQGASMAMEDAVVLARELAAEDTIPAALAAFDRQRHPRSGKLAKTEAANRDAKTAGPIATRMREMIMPHVFNRFYEKATGWLYDYDPGSLPARQTR
jgi:2-polyprenyl-6-methoxyphenol hydroxylase-like FAD-dependent oxidoreductase